MNNIIKSRISKDMRLAMRYFWASFALQILVYALLAHVIVKYWNDIFTVLPALMGILLYIPFTHTVMKRFKAMAFMSITPGETTIRDYVTHQKSLLGGFLLFKKRYELFLIPLSCAIGVLLTFKLYVPGGAYRHPQGALVVLALSLISCYLAIRNENKKNFERPLNDLDKILNEYKSEESPL